MSNQSGTDNCTDLLYTGTYVPFNTWYPSYPSTNVHDGNWATYGRASFDAANSVVLFINYTPSPYSTSDVILKYSFVSFGIEQYEITNFIDNNYSGVVPNPLMIAMVSTVTGQDYQGANGYTFYVNDSKFPENCNILQPRGCIFLYVNDGFYELDSHRLLGFRLLEEGITWNISPPAVTGRSYTSIAGNASTSNPYLHRTQTDFRPAVEDGLTSSDYDIHPGFFSIPQKAYPTTPNVTTIPVSAGGGNPIYANHAIIYLFVLAVGAYLIVKS